MFKTTGTVNKDILDEIKKFFIPRNFLFIFALELAGVIYLAVMGYMYDLEYVAIVLIYSLFLVFIACCPRPNRAVKFELERMAELTGKREADYTVYFEDDCVVMQNLSSGGINRVKYDRLKSLKKCKTVYALFTKTEMFIPIFISCLSEKDKNELLTYLKTHAPQLKI